MKTKYKIRNWKVYNRSLINRGNLMLWIPEDIVASWYADRDPKAGRGRPLTYSNACMELALTLRTIFRLPLRGTQGFLEGFARLMRLSIKVPHYSTFSRRAADLQISLHQRKKSDVTDIVLDSTGLKVYGEGEWKIRIHGKQKRRTWRKYHVAVDSKSHEVVSMELTEANVHDSEVVPGLMKNLRNIGNVYGDGAYPTRNSLDAIAHAGGHAVIPPRTGTCIVKINPSLGEQQRNRLVRERRAAGGKKAWKKSSGYHRRSLVETHMFRVKTIFGGSLHSRTFSNQQAEARLMPSILNRMTALGMPDSVVK